MLVNLQDTETEDRLSRVRSQFTGTFVEWDCRTGSALRL